MGFTISWDDVKKRASLAVVALLLAGCVHGAGASGASARSTQVIVRAAAGGRLAATRQIEAAGGRVVRQLGIIESVVASVPASAVGRLRELPGVQSVTPDRSLRLMSTGDTFDRKADVGSLWNTARTSGVDEVWARGFSGAGVDVALIDSGVNRVGGLEVAGAVVDGPDLSFDAVDPDRIGRDGFGHGTHLAGIIAGRRDNARGMAPDARVVSIKVADRNGTTDVSQVIAAIDWVVQRSQDDGFNIRVINLAFGTDGGPDYRLDPLAFAAEVAWQRGLVVVVSAGNVGDSLGRLTSPATDPYVLAVGAAETVGTRTVADDVIPSFSSRGDGQRNPDVVAPGRSIVSVRAPGSLVDEQHPSARVGSDLFRGSGTSQAAAVVSGLAALLLQQRPVLTPDQVKAALISTARVVPSAPATAQGAGLVNALAALQIAPSTTAQSWERSNGTGTLESARGSLHAVFNGQTISGEMDAWGRSFDSAGWAAASASGSSWSGSSWSGSSWSGSSWSGSSWSGSSWSGSSWSGSTWSGSSWSATEWG